MIHEELKKISGLSETLFLPLYCRAMESRTKDPILNDQKSILFVKKIDEVFSESNSKLHKMLHEYKLPGIYIKKINLLTKKFDEYTNKFLKENPNGIVVNMGCGLDTRFYRIKNSNCEFYDIDLEEVIDLKKQLIDEIENYHLIGCSLLDPSWINKLSKKKDQPFLFLAQGVFGYMPEKEVKSLIIELQKNFSGCEIVFDIVNSFFIKREYREKTKKNFQNRYNLGKNVAYNFGIDNSNELTFWNEGIIFLDDWGFYDEFHKKLRFHLIDRFFEHFRRTIFIVHYKLI